MYRERPFSLNTALCRHPIFFLPFTNHPCDILDSMQGLLKNIAGATISSRNFHILKVDCAAQSSGKVINLVQVTEQC